MIFGRDNELAALDADYANMLAGHGSVLFLTGEAGLGKTTLVHTWAKERDMQSTSKRQSGVHNAKPAPQNAPLPSLFLESACSIPIGNVDVGRLEALQPWADVVAQLHEKLDTESNGKTDSFANSEKLNASNPTAKKGMVPNKLDVRKLMRDAAPAWLWALPFVGEVAHAALVTARLVQDQRAGIASQIQSPTAPDPSSSPINNNTSAPVINERQFAASNQEQVFQQYVNLLTKISGETPLVIFLDDLHWADTSSCNLLFYLARQIAGKKIFVIATYRQDDAVRAEDGKGHAILTIKNEILRYSTGRELALSYLNRDAIRLFLAKTFVGYVDDEKFEAWLHRISDGNSLFMTQFVRTLREDGHLDERGKFVGDYATVVIPTSALAIVEQRTRRLDADTRELLMYATAEGEEFTTYILEHLAEMKPMALLKKLHGATAMGLITQRGTGRLYANATTGIFGFSHALFHKALYDGLLDMQKQHLHQQCFHLLKAEWERLEDSKQRTTTLATKLLAHAGKCEEWTTVAEVALAAAQEFWIAYNEGEALAMITKVLEAGDRADGLVADRLVVERAEALFLRGRIGSLRGRHNESVADYRAAEALFRSADIVLRAVDAVGNLAETHFRSASYDKALVEAERALLEARTVGHVKCEASMLRIIGNVHTNRGAYDEALSFYERSLAMCAAVGDRRGEALCLNNIGIVHNRRGAYDEALSSFERGLAMNAAIGDRHFETLIQCNISIVHGRRGAYDEALSGFQRSLAMCAAIGDRHNEASNLNNIGIVHNRRGAYHEALSSFERSLAMCAAIGHRRGEADVLKEIGSALRQLGEIAGARNSLEQGLAIAAEISARDISAEATAELGLVTEAESQTHAGTPRDAKFAEAIRLVEEGIAMFRELKLSEDTVKWKKELERMKTTNSRQ